LREITSLMIKYVEVMIITGVVAEFGLVDCREKWDGGGEEQPRGKKGKCVGVLCFFLATGWVCQAGAAIPVAAKARLGARGGGFSRWRWSYR
jgi:hypothetical protein